MLDQSHMCIPWDATRGKTGKGGAGGAWEWLRKSRNGCPGSCPSRLSDGGKGELADLPSVCSKIPIKTPEHFPDRSEDRAQQLCLSLEKTKPSRNSSTACSAPYTEQKKKILNPNTSGSLFPFCWRAGNVRKSFWETGKVLRIPAHSHPRKLWDILEKWVKNQECERNGHYRSRWSGSFEGNELLRRFR